MPKYISNRDLSPIETVLAAEPGGWGIGETILNLHALLSDNLLGDPKASGRLRAIPVSIGKSVYEPLAVPQLIDEIIRQILSITSAISDPFEQAFFVTVHLPYLQPFEDVNKRVSRLAANISLIRHNLCPLSFLDVPEDLAAFKAILISEKSSFPKAQIQTTNFDSRIIIWIPYFMKCYHSKPSIICIYGNK